MGYIEATADFDTAVIEAGDRFVSQVKPVLHPRSLAVVLLNSGGHPGQVAFTWGLRTDSEPPIARHWPLRPALLTSRNIRYE